MPDATRSQHPTSSNEDRKWSLINLSNLREVIETPVKKNPSNQFFLHTKRRRKTGSLYRQILAWEIPFFLLQLVCQTDIRHGLEILALIG